MDIHETRKLNLRLARYRESFDRIKTNRVERAKAEKIRIELEEAYKRVLRLYAAGEKKAVIFIDRTTYSNRCDFLCELEKVLREDHITAKMISKSYGSHDEMWKFEYEFVEG